MVEQGFDDKYLRTLSHSHNQVISDLVMRGIFGLLSTFFFMLVFIFFFIPFEIMVKGFSLHMV